MIRLARLTGSPADDPREPVAGLPVLLRQLLSLQDAGIEEVELDGALPQQLMGDPRLSLRVTERSTAQNAEPRVSARRGMVWHPALARRAARLETSADLEAMALEPGEFIVSAGSPDDRRRAEELLLKTLFKSSDGIVSRLLNRHISLRVTRLLLDTSITPNQMTWIASLFGLAAITVVAVYGVAALVPGAALLQVQSILDGCDGEISRLKYLRSRLGEWLDQVWDDVVNLGYFAATGYALYRAGSSVAGLVTIAGVVCHLIYQTSLYTALLTRGGGSGSVTAIRWWGQPAATAARGESRESIWGRLEWVVEMAARRDFFTLLYLPCALTGTNMVALIWAAVIFVVSGVMTGLQWIVAGGPNRA